MTYQQALAAALKRRQAKLNSDAESMVTPLGGTSFRQAASVVARRAVDDHFITIGLCPHGKVPRLIAERMGLPGIGCQRCV
jgi:hypothetical protein